MATIIEKKEAYRKAFTIKAVPFLKEVLGKCKLGYNDIQVTETSKKHGMSLSMVSTMVDMQVLSRIGNNRRNSKFHWKSEAPLIETQFKDLATKIYDRINQDIRTKKANDALAKKQNEALGRKKNYVPVIGTKRVLEPNDKIALSILRSMEAVYGETQDGQLKSFGFIVENIKKEISNESKAEQIGKALVDGKYIIEKFGNVKPELRLYTWIEQPPSEEHANFIKDMMKETAPNDKVNRIFEFLQFLATITVFTKVKLREKVKEYNLYNNDQSVITGEVLEFTGNKVSRKYKWKLAEPASIELAQKVADKCLVYSKKYAAKPKEKIAKTDIVNPSVPSTVKTIKIKPAKPMLSINVDTTDPLFNIKNAVAIMKIERDKNVTAWNLMKIKIDSIEAKINEGIALIDIKEKERLFLSSCAEFGVVENMTFLSNVLTNVVNKPAVIETAVSNSQTRQKGERHNHTARTIVKFLTGKESASLDEVKEHFYPGQNLRWDSDAVKSLSAMIYYLRKKKVIENISAGNYKLNPLLQSPKKRNHGRSTCSSRLLIGRMS